MASFKEIFQLEEASSSLPITIFFHFALRSTFANWQRKITDCWKLRRKNVLCCFPTLSDLDLIIASLFIILTDALATGIKRKLLCGELFTFRVREAMLLVYQVHNIIITDFPYTKTSSSSTEESTCNLDCKSSINYFANAFYLKSISRCVPFHLLICYFNYLKHRRTIKDKILLDMLP